MKILLWAVSNNVQFLNGAIKILERQHNDFEVIGITAVNEVPLYKNGQKVNFIPLDKLIVGGVMI